MKITDRITQLVLARKPALGVRNVKRDIATTCAISYQAVREWFTGGTENIKNENLVALSKGYDTTVDWLLMGKGESPRRKGMPPQTDQDTGVGTDLSPKTCKGQIEIPQYDVGSVMGHGQIPVECFEFVRNIVVSTAEFEKLGAEVTAAANLSLLTGWGVSMKGTINDKDPLFVDRGVNKFVGEGVYVFTWLCHLFIKRVQLLDAEHYLLVSDNKEFEPQTARMNDVTFHARAVIVLNIRRL